MTFEEMLDQAIAMLQRRGRLTYGALRRQFNLDDGYLEDLKDELIYGQQLAADEGGKVLVWKGAPAALVSQTPLQDDLLTQRQPSSAVSRRPDAERRQLTVVFCDLVDSTALSGRLDPEDLRGVVRAYQEAAAEIIHRYEGYIAQYLGDGLLIYSGYPQAHEDDTHRAIRIGLGIVEAIEHLNPRLEQKYTVRLAVRVGIHTGPVVVGEMGGGGRHEQLALGETPNLAARLEGLVMPGQVVISQSTRHLVGGTFELEDLGVHTLKGVAEPIQAYRIRWEREIESRFEAATVSGLTPLVGREEEIDLVLRRWEQAIEGDGQVVLLCGEPGIGKSRLTQAVREQMAEVPHIRVRYQCSPYAINSALYPVITQFERAAQFTRDDTPDQKLAKLEALLVQTTERVAEIAPLFAALLAIPPSDHYPPLSLTPQRQKEKTIEVLVDQLVELSHRQPVLVIFEDAHWSDPTSLEVLDLLIHRVFDVQMLVVITYQPEFEPPWPTRSHTTPITLNRLVRPQVGSLITRLSDGKALPDEVVQHIVDKTDGVPLFVEELTKTVLESGLLATRGDRYELTGPLPPLAIPVTLQDSLMARLDRLEAAKEVAQLGAMIGRDFSYELLAAVSLLPEDALQEALDQLVHVELIFRRGTPPEATYLFKHALVQDAAYASLLKSRRQQLHTHIATVLEKRFDVIVKTQPELLAHHYTEAGLTAQAIPYWLLAGQKAFEAFALAEALVHLHTGLELVEMSPVSTQRDHAECDVRLALGLTYLAQQGWQAPPVAEHLEPVYNLGQQLGAGETVLPIVTYGLFLNRLCRGEYHTSQIWVDRMHRDAEAADSTILTMMSHLSSTIQYIWLGRYREAIAHAEQGVMLYDPDAHGHLVFLLSQDPKSFMLHYWSWSLWFLGYPDQAVKVYAEAEDHSRAVGHPFDLAYILSVGADLLFFCGKLEEHAECVSTQPELI